MLKGGTFSELNILDVSKKTIVLMGELHTLKLNVFDYNNVIDKQIQIIDLVKNKFGENNTFFYSEAPDEYKDRVLKDNNIHSSVIVQYAKTIIPIKLSNVTTCDRDISSCDEKYADDILSIFNDNENINCIIVAIGLLHIPELKKFIYEKRPDIQIIVVNTVSMKELTLFIKEIEIRYPSVIELLNTESPYELQSSNETFIVKVLSNEYGNKIYECPVCGFRTGTAAPKYITDTSLFHHIHWCPNKNKIPIEPPSEEPPLIEHIQHKSIFSKKNPFHSRRLPNYFTGKSKKTGGRRRTNKKRKQRSRKTSGRH